MNRRLSEEERALWTRVAATVKPLGPRRRAANPAPAIGQVTKPPNVAPETSAAPRAHTAPKASADFDRARGASPGLKIGAGFKIGAGLKPAPCAAAPPFSAALDKRSEERLKRGQRPIDARLDLHGMTQAAAQAAVIGFVARALEHGQRCLLIITGKGGKQGGILRAALPHWLQASAFAPAILRHVPAALHHGGEGAFYVLLKRRRDRA
jgi:DNA-nicking Smr family endonuclease